MTPTLRERARALPRRPGVYLFKDAQGRVLYVGKAKALRARVSQYDAPKRRDPAKRDLPERTADFEVIVTKNEAEALALEATLIERHKPPYNVRLVDDSSYLYVRISRDTYPQVSLVRRVLPDEAWYRGPFPIASAIRATLRAARKLFPWCEYSGQTPDARRQMPVARCQTPDDSRQMPDAGLQSPDARRRSPEYGNWRPCFAYHLGLCPGICAGRISLEEYQRGIAGLKRFLDGDVRHARAGLRARMADASARLDYERAAKIRDTIAHVEKATMPQSAVTPRRESLDVLGIARHGTHAVVTVLSVRMGRVVGSLPFSLVTPASETTAAVLRSFLLGYLPRAADGAQKLFLPETIEDRNLLNRHRVLVPSRGWKRHLLDIARANAESALAAAAAELMSPGALHAALRELSSVLRLEQRPRRIEAYDVSNIQGTLATASLVVFRDGGPLRREYRKFKIALPTPNDVGMMREALRRRFGKHAPAPPPRARVRAGKRARELTRAHAPTLARSTEWPLPDLILLDGGKGQLNAGRAVLRELGLSIPLMALAKRAEEIFLPGQRNPLRLPAHSQALYLLQRIRDEAHRFTLGYHQLLRKKRMTRSILEEIPGVGDATRKKLLRRFGSLKGIRTTPPEDLAKVAGPKLAGTIKRWLDET